mgnify:FL=1
MVLQVHAGGRKGVTLLEIAIALAVLAILLISLGASFGALGRQSEMNRQLAVVTSEVGNALSMIHTAPFEAIGQELALNGYTALGGFSYRKDLTGIPFCLSDGQVAAALLGVTGAEGSGVVMPDPLNINVTVSWTSAAGAALSRTFATVRTR